MLAVPLMDGLVPVTVTVYVPPLPLQLSVLVPDPPVIEGGDRVQARPEGETEDVSETVPAKPLTGSTSMLVVPVTPGVVLMVVGLANIWKSTTWTFIVAVVWLSGLLVPLTVTV
jgi:hypothetical protein